MTHIVCTNQVVGKNLWMMDFVRKPCVETVLRCTSTITGLNIQRFETRKFSMIIEKMIIEKINSNVKMTHLTERESVD